MRALGMVREAASDFQQYQEGRAAKQAEADQAEGAEAAAAGLVDPAKQQESKAYQAGVLWQRGDADWATRQSAMEQGVQQLIQGQTDPDPAKREAEVAEFLEQQNRAFAVDEEGNLRDFGSPAAARHFATQMGQVRGVLLPQAASLIRKRMGEESLSNMATAVIGKLKAGQQIDPADEFARLLPSVDRRAAVETLMQAVEAAAGEAQQSDPQAGLRMIDGLLGWAQRGSGRPTDDLPKPLIPGNLSEAIRYRVKNSDGSVSTVRTMSIGTDEGEVLIPTVVDDKVVSDEAAIEHFRKTGENFGTFKTPEEATAYAMALHSRHEAQLAKEGTAPTTGLLQPFQGFTAGKRTGKMGDARSGGSSHNGEDFPVPVGTPITSPLGGEVISSMRNARGGNQVRVRLDNGAIVGFAHLSSREVQVGQRVEAGAQLGLSGNTGKSTGPHVHMTMEVDGRKVSPSDYFAQRARAALPTSEALGSAFGSAGSGEDSGGEVSTITPLEGPLALSPGQVLHLQEFRRTYSQRAEAEAERRRSEDQAGNLSQLIARLTGAEGNYPTKAEVQAKVRAGAVSPQQGMQLLNIIDGDTRQARSDARQAVAWAREDQRESKESYLRSRVGSLLGPVYAGRATITETVGKLTAAVSRESDPELRQALMQSVHGELSQLQTLRQKGPEYQGAGDDLDGWEDAYGGQLGKVRLPRGMDTQSARGLIRSKLDEVRTELGRGNVPPDRVKGYMESAERRLDLWFSQTFPPRAVKR
ncbi:hypothetical protein NRB_26090 [Novosphingobium sp. 11B]